MRRWRGFCAALVPLLSAAAIAGCGSSNSSSSSTTSSSSSGSGGASASSTSSSSSASTSADPKVVALVPKTIKSKGTLTVASDASYAPDEFFASDGHTVIGMDADLSKALAAVMGLKVNVVNAAFDTIIPGLASGKYDIGASSFTDTKEREKTVDFVTYSNVGESFFTKASGGTSINSIADLCGHTVAVEKGTTEQTDAEAQSAKCKKAGKPGGHGAHVPRPERRQPGALQRPGPARASPTRRRPPTRSRSPTASSSWSARPTPPRRTAWRCPRATGWTQPVLAALKVLMKNGPTRRSSRSGDCRARAITNPKINGAIS